MRSPTARREPHSPRTHSGSANSQRPAQSGQSATALMRRHEISSPQTISYISTALWVPSPDSLVSAASAQMLSWISMSCLASAWHPAQMKTSPASLNEPRTRNRWQTAQMTGDRGTATSSRLALEPGHPRSDALDRAVGSLIAPVMRRWLHRFPVPLSGEEAGR